MKGKQKLAKLVLENMGIFNKFLNTLEITDDPVSQELRENLTKLEKACKETLKND